MIVLVEMLQKLLMWIKKSEACIWRNNQNFPQWWRLAHKIKFTQNLQIEAYACERFKIKKTCMWIGMNKFLSMKLSV